MRWLTRLLVLVAIAAAGFIAWAWRPAMPDGVPPARASLDNKVISHGSDLAAIGNCAQCHTAPSGKTFAGGRAVPTPFGTVWGPNITPDIETGIGRYSRAAFVRAMHDGVDRLGRHLYPAFPYDHMAKMTEDDIGAVWAFLITREPVRQVNPVTQLTFPLNQRILLAAWKALFFDRRPFMPNPAKSAEWNHGAYLVEGLAHCGACHTPRNFLGAEIKNAAFGGGQAEGWNAPALNSASPAAVPWTADRLTVYLRHGRDELHGASVGPMNEVTHSLSSVPASDVAAIAIYVADISGNATQERVAAAVKATERKGVNASAATGISAGLGAAIYAGACAQCHGDSGRAPINPAINLAMSSSVRAPEPTNFLNIIRSGVHQPEGVAGPFMPAFADSLTPAQIRDVATYVRATFSGQPPWSGFDEAMRRAQAGK